MKVLIISPCFPPTKSVATLRMASLCTFLTNKQLAEVTVLTNSIKNDCKKRQLSETLSHVKLKEVIECNENSFFKNFIKNYKLYKKSVESLLEFNYYDVVLISVDPHYTLPLAKLIKRKYKTKLIIDYRDLWIFSKNYKTSTVTDFFKILISKLILFPVELSSIIYADKIVTVTDNWKKKLQNIYRIFSDKFEVIHNGYDDQLLSKNIFFQNQNDQKNFIIANYGKLSSYSPHYAEIFFRSIYKLKDDIVNLKVVQVGNIEDETINIISKLNISQQYFECTGFCDYTEGLQTINEGSILVIVDNRPDAIGTKVYDYIFLNKPIIYVGPKNGNIPDLLKSFTNAFVCSETQEVIEAIKKIYTQKIYNLSAENNSYKYGRSIQNQKFYKLMKELNKRNEIVFK